MLKKLMLFAAGVLSVVPVCALVREDVEVVCQSSFPEKIDYTFVIGEADALWIEQAFAGPRDRSVAVDADRSMVNDFLDVIKKGVSAVVLLSCPTDARKTSIVQLAFDTQEQTDGTKPAILKSVQISGAWKTAPESMVEFVIACCGVNNGSSAVVKVVGSVAVVALIAAGVFFRDEINAQVNERFGSRKIVVPVVKNLAQKAQSALLHAYEVDRSEPACPRKVIKTLVDLKAGSGSNLIQNVTKNLLALTGSAAGSILVLTSTEWYSDICTVKSLVLANAAALHSANVKVLIVNDTEVGIPAKDLSGRDFIRIPFSSDLQIYIDTGLKTFIEDDLEIVSGYPLSLFVSYWAPSYRLDLFSGTRTDISLSASFTV